MGEKELQTEQEQDTGAIKRTMEKVKGNFAGNRGQNIGINREEK